MSKQSNKPEARPKDSSVFSSMRLRGGKCRNTTGRLFGGFGRSVTDHANLLTQAAKDLRHIGDDISVPRSSSSDRRVEPHSTTSLNKWDLPPSSFATTPMRLEMELIDTAAVVLSLYEARRSLADTASNHALLKTNTSSVEYADSQVKMQTMQQDYDTAKKRAKESYATRSSMNTDTRSYVSEYLIKRGLEQSDIEDLLAEVDENESRAPADTYW